MHFNLNASPTCQDQFGGRYQCRRREVSSVTTWDALLERMGSSGSTRLDWGRNSTDVLRLDGVGTGVDSIDREIALRVVL